MDESFKKAGTDNGGTAHAAESPEQSQVAFCTECGTKERCPAGTKLASACSLCGVRCRIWTVGGPEPLMIVRSREGDAWTTTTAEEVARALLEGRASSDDLICKIPPVSSLTRDPGQEARSEGATVGLLASAGLSPSVHFAEEPLWPWKALGAWGAFPVRVLFHPVAAYGAQGAQLAFRAGGILGVLSILIAYFTQELPGLPYEANPGFAPRAAFLLSCAALYCACAQARWRACGCLALIPLWLSCIWLGAVGNPVFLALGFCIGMGASLAGGFLAGGVALGAVGYPIGLIVGLARRGRIPSLPPSERRAATGKPRQTYGQGPLRFMGLAACILLVMAMIVLAVLTDR